MNEQSENYFGLGFYVLCGADFAEAALGRLGFQLSILPPSRSAHRSQFPLYYCCGSRIEALVTDEYHDGPYWTRTSVEHDGEDYYLVGNMDISMNGLTVRVR